MKLPEKIQTTTWWAVPAPGVPFASIVKFDGSQEHVTRYPKLATPYEISIWNGMVLAKFEALTAEGEILLDFRPFEEEHHHGLWGRKTTTDSWTPIMYPGIQYRMTNWPLNSTTINVEKMLFSEVMATQRPEYRKLFTRENMSLPQGPLAPVLWLKCPDGFVLTRRGSGTPMYPGACWGIGGNVDSDTVKGTVQDHIFHELHDETDITDALRNMRILGVVFDKVLWKHDLVVSADTDIPFSDMGPGKRYLPDVSRLALIPGRAEILMNAIRESHLNSLDPDDPRWRRKLTPPAIGGLTLVGNYLYGGGWLHTVMNTCFPTN
ncbi:MAG: hypothetical protein ABIJ92_00525 [Candidatus Aenigmatarchaeota archaeon]